MVEVNSLKQKQNIINNYLSMLTSTIILVDQVYYLKYAIFNILKYHVIIIYFLPIIQIYFY